MSRIYAGVDLGGTSFIAVIADKKGKVLGSSDGPTTRGAKAETTIDQIAEHIRAAAKDAGVKTSKIGAIGIGAAGAVDPKRGVVVRAPNLGWNDVPVARILQKKLGPDVVLGNDVQVAIIGEHSYGAAKGTKRAVGVWVGTGIGGGLIVDGEIDKGFRGAAGEIGHMMIKEDGPTCSCGRKGCVEALASRSAMERDVRARPNSAVLKIMKERGKDRMTSSVIEQALDAGDPVMKEVLARAQHYLGLLTGNIVNMFDPEMVVIGGGVAQRLKKKFVEPIAEVARTRFLRPDPHNRIRIEHATLGDYSGALGACALARQGV
ncbi:MAG TPA: ROK family protein [Thermoanaerobaculia bacterium]|nr:ROK family protein [Thermoanaerobaculia bacterium]